ncbi:hypothetical protein HPB48_008386 [Haemaphysalis longicornis]|uniref:Endonuclease/exonuclease/phosphatase domain-containing protein n=1 Tax=Haemaphysalis longicornis TaxID=44386 RepID=A0A9J6FE12_HAELO|nr:hypothetical protein HPB48_008386 [Haemaphysalis longicornis]
MDRASTTATTTAVKGLLVWHWNCNGFAGKKPVLQQHLQQVSRKPDIIMLQETRIEEVKLSGYRSHASPPSLRAVAGSSGRGVCTLVRKHLPYVEHELLSKSTIEHTMV